MNKNLIEERAINDPEIAEYIRAEIARMEKDANLQFQLEKDRLQREAREMIDQAVKRATKSVEDAKLRDAYRHGKQVGFTHASLYVAVLSVATYLIVFGLAL